MITVTGHGNVVSEPEMRTTGTGKAVITVRVAAYNGKEEKLFIDLEAWEDLAVNVEKSLHKGDRVTFSGTLREDSWTNKEGETRRKPKISLREIGPSLTFATTTSTKTEFGGLTADEGREQVSRARDQLVDAKAVADTEMPF